LVYQATSTEISGEASWIDYENVILLGETDVNKFTD